MSLKKDEFVCNCSDIDDIIIFFRDGTYKVVKVSDKMFVGKNVLYLNVFKRNDNRTIYNVIYRDGKTVPYYIKRFAVTGVTRDKDYDLTKGNAGSRFCISANPNGEAETVKVNLKPKPRQKLLVFEKDFSSLQSRTSSMVICLLKPRCIKLTLSKRSSSTLGRADLGARQRRAPVKLRRQRRGLGEFLSDDLILVICRNGDFFTTNLT
jgi:topoisomerase-4 subunit A